MNLRRLLTPLGWMLLGGPLTLLALLVLIGLFLYGWHVYTTVDCFFRGFSAADSLRGIP